MPRILERPTLRRHLRRLLDHGNLSEEQQHDVRAAIRELGVLNFLQDQIEPAAIEAHASGEFNAGRTVRDWLWDRRAADVELVARLAAGFRG